MARPARRAVPAAAALVAAAAICGCSDPDRERLKATTKPTYDKTTGQLKELTFDANRNGRIDTWTDMDGTRPLRSRIDTDEDGTLDRWEYYNDAGRLARVGMSRNGNGQPDAWAYSTADGRIARIESSSVGDEVRIDRWEYYDTTAAPAAAGPGPLLRVESDSNHDGRADKWERYTHGVLETAEFDENGDGRPDRRITYRGADLVSIETAPDGHGRYGKKTVPAGSR
ncbi:MAG TPA: hypothetical protein VFJ02_03360 [Vicinamibacterales bacterium]|nr:hypothetical protein [Vicinamibacterales bacterium]